MIEEILEKLERPLLQYVFSFTNDVEIARDIVQDAFIQLQKHIHKLDEKYRTPWLYKVCRNRSLDWKRKMKRVVEMDEQMLENNQCPEPMPSEKIERQEQISILMQLVETLPVNQREVLRLSYQNQLSYKEISEITGLSVSNVGYLLSTALKSLRQKMQRQHTDERIVMMSKA